MIREKARVYENSLHCQNIIIFEDLDHQRRKNPMTICIAAICKEDDHESIVFATDHMVSLGDINQFEHKVKKYKVINNNVVALLSGQFLLFDDLIQLPDKDLSYSEIVNEIFNNFKRIRGEKVKNEILDRAQLDRDDMLGFLSRPELNPVLMKIFKDIWDYSLNTTILLAGLEGDKARLTEIDEERIEQCRDLFFTTIGIGYEAAYNTLLYQKHNRTDPLKTAIYNVYKAKRNTEHLSGIGQETEILVLDKTGLRYIKEEKPLRDIFDEESKYGKEKVELTGLQIERCSIT